MPKAGPHAAPTPKRHALRCCMCGIAFYSARPDATTHSNLCRSFLRRWKAKYGAAPTNPPGLGNIKPWNYNFDAFLRAYVDVVAYTKHKKARK